MNSTCGAILAAQTACTISIGSTYISGDTSGTPLIAGGSILIMDDANGGPQFATLSSQNLGSIGGPSASFPSAQVGYSQTLQSDYSGYNAYEEYPWPPISFTVGGANPSDFSIQVVQNGSVTTSPCSSGRYGANPCQMTYTFSPTTTGARTAKAFLTYSGNYGPGYQGTVGQPYVLLQGTGAAAGPSFTVNQTLIGLQSELPSNIDPKSIGSTTLTLQNTGSTTVKIAASFTGVGSPYMAADLSNCSAPVAPHGTCLINVTFSAPTVGSYPATLTLSDTNSSFTLPINILGGTSNWSLTISGSALSFPTQAVGTTSATRTFTIADPNGYPLGHAYSIALQPSSNFVLTQGSTCPASTTQLCTLAVAFAPQVVGNIYETATITDQTTGATTSLVLNGTSGTFSYTLSSSSLTFASRSVNTTSAPIAVTLTNNGTQGLTIYPLTITGPGSNNFTQTNNCVGMNSVAANASCSINITFAPTATGAQSATLQIDSNAVNSPTSISLTGTATP